MQEVFCIKELTGSGACFGSALSAPGWVNVEENNSNRIKEAALREEHLTFQLTDNQGVTALRVNGQGLEQNRWI